MSQLLILYEIAEKARSVTSKKKLREFERWVKEILSRYQDAAVQQVANMHLFRLKEEFTTI